jgi:hypothetical protein
MGEGDACSFNANMRETNLVSAQTDIRDIGRRRFAVMVIQAPIAPE